MDIDFWKNRWDARQIAFHEGKPNAILADHAFLLEGRKRILVPLAGKTVDMVFLERLGLEVLGVEAVETACREFFSDQDRAPIIERRGGFQSFQSNKITMLQGDFFSVAPPIAGAFDAVYDRAALVALDPKTRATYVEVLRSVMNKGARMLLVAFTYDQHLVDGPPWSVDERTVRDLFWQGFVIEPREKRQAAVSPKLKDAGVKDLFEQLFVITKL